MSLQKESSFALYEMEALRPIELSQILPYIPDANNCVDPEFMKNSIDHGVAHSFESVLWATYLLPILSERGVKDLNHRVIKYGCGYHDIGRNNETEHNGHGLYSASQLEREWFPDLSPDEFQELWWLCVRHSGPASGSDWPDMQVVRTIDVSLIAARYNGTIHQPYPPITSETLSKIGLRVGYNPAISPKEWDKFLKLEEFAHARVVNIVRTLQINPFHATIMAFEQLNLITSLKH